VRLSKHHCGPDKSSTGPWHRPVLWGRTYSKNRANEGALSLSRVGLR